ncbi:MAG: hypothetical protein R3F11_27100 [Verrucomicrobiales bacterium]
MHRRVSAGLDARLATAVAMAAAALVPGVAKAQLIGRQAYLKGDFVEAGLGRTARMARRPRPANYHSRTNNPSGLGFVSDRHKDGWAAFDGDFFAPGTPLEGWFIQVGGSIWNNAENVGKFEIPGSLSSMRTTASGSRSSGTDRSAACRSTRNTAFTRRGSSCRARSA